MRNRGFLRKIAVLAVVLIVLITALPLSAATISRISWLNRSATASGVEFGTHSSYWDDSGYLHIVGEVINNTGSNIKFVKIIATYYNQQSAVIGTDYAYTELSILVPGQKSPFDVSSYPDLLPDYDHLRYN